MTYIDYKNSNSAKKREKKAINHFTLGVRSYDMLCQTRTFCVFPWQPLFKVYELNLLLFV